MKLLSINDPNNEDLFSQIQGNILKGHGRNHTAHVFFSILPDNQKKFSHFMKTFSHRVTSFKKQLIDTESYRSTGNSETFFGIAFTANGLRKSGFQPENMEESFVNGMKAAKHLSDPNVEEWEAEYQEIMDGMILLADDNQEQLGNELNAIIKAVKVFASIVTIEFGHVIRNDKGDGLEHFGYVDGISQPIFLKEDLEQYLKKHQTTEKYLDFNPAAAVETVLFNDPLVNDSNAFGSYFVFRKLEQNVKGFKEAEEKLGKELGYDDSEIIGAYLVGRFEDGTPITLSDSEGFPHAGRFNNFDYKNDQQGAKCPFHAHIRATNPRVKEHKKHIMARRGITYGHRNVPLSAEQFEEVYPTKDVGLLFMSYQSSIKDQFEYIQLLANGKSKKNTNSFLDPIIGQDNVTDIRPGKLPSSYGEVESLKECNFKNFVTLKGGDYFFTPSITLLKKL